jgi:hypothetical protein
MARFYSKHEIAKMDKGLTEDELLNTQKYKNDLKKALNDEYHRINIDSAKKKAVNQRMDYDGFHQMVLGADLKGLKKDDVSNIVSNKNCIMNSSLLNNKLSEVDIISKNFINTGDDTPELNDKQTPIIEDFKTMDYKTFVKQWKGFNTGADKLELLKANCDGFASILSSTPLIDADFFGDFLYQCGSGLNKDNLYLLVPLALMVENKHFASLKKFISKKTKTLYNELDFSEFGNDERLAFETIKKAITS